MKAARLIFASIMMLASLCTNAQGIKAYLKDGTLLDYEITDISQVTIITLPDGTKGFAIYDVNGNIVQYPLDVLTGVRCEDQTGFYLGHKAVDLGLPSGTLWAEYNVGASKPEEFGNYFYWGNTKGVKGYVTPYIDYDNRGHYTKYVTEGKKMDMITELMSEDDVAHEKWGDEWCIPTMTQKRELLKYTAHVRDTVNGVAGWRFYSILNDNSLFFPASGIYYSDRVERVGEQTNIWTSTLYTKDNAYAYVMCDRMNSTMLDGAGFDMDAQSEAFNLSQYRSMGLPVRPVVGKAADKQKQLTSAYPNDIIKISATSMELVSFVRTDAPASSVSCGVCYSTTEKEPDIENSNFILGTLTDDRCITDLIGLKPSTGYYVRYFLIIDRQRQYSEVSFITTSDAESMVTTGNVMSSTTTTATIRSGFNLETAVYDNVEKWICYGLSANPTIDGDKAAASGNNIACRAELTGLTPNATYHYRACLKIDGQTLYGDDLTFVAEDYGTPLYVDLGLPSGLLWATMNVGASSPEEVGNYYAWAEVTSRTSFDGSTYLYRSTVYDEKNNNMTKYNSKDRMETIQSEDDAATVNWGNAWRTPTMDECSELIDTCKFESAMLNGVECVKCTGPNGNCIYFPMSGYYTGLTFSQVVYPIIWTSSLRYQWRPYNTNYSLARSVILEANRQEVIISNRSDGINVRPVRKK